MTTSEPADQYTIPITEEVQALLDREIELLDLHDKYSGDAFWAERNARIAATKKSNVTTEEIEKAAEALDGTLGNYYDGRRAAIYEVILAHRAEGFRVFCDQFLQAVLDEINKRREGLSEAVKALNKAYPNAGVTMNQEWHFHTVTRLEEFIYSEGPDPVFLHNGFKTLIGSYRV